VLYRVLCFEKLKEFITVPYYYRRKIEINFFFRKMLMDNITSLNPIKCRCFQAANL